MHLDEHLTCPHLWHGGVLVAENFGPSTLVCSYCLHRAHGGLHFLVDDTVGESTTDQKPLTLGRSPSGRADAPTIAQLIAIWMTEEFTDDGGRVGYIDLFDSEPGETVVAADFDDTNFITETEARRLAEERGWHFRVA